MRIQSRDNNVELGDKSLNEIVEEIPCDPVILIEMPTEAVYVDEIVVTETDAGATPVEYDHNDDLQYVGSHVMINGVCSLLNRPKNPTFFEKRSGAFYSLFLLIVPENLFH